MENTLKEPSFPPSISPHIPALLPPPAAPSSAPWWAPSHQLLHRFSHLLHLAHSYAGLLHRPRRPGQSEGPRARSKDPDGAFIVKRVSGWKISEEKKEKKIVFFPLRLLHLSRPSPLSSFHLIRLAKIDAQDAVLAVPKLPDHGSLTGKPAKTGRPSLLPFLLSPHRPQHRRPPPRPDAAPRRRFPSPPSRCPLVKPRRETSGSTWRKRKKNRGRRREEEKKRKEEEEEEERKRRRRRRREEEKEKKGRKEN